MAKLSRLRPPGPLLWRSCDCAEPTGVRPTWQPDACLVLLVSLPLVALVLVVLVLALLAGCTQTLR
jgi:hypothetical protein